MGNRYMCVSKHETDYALIDSGFTNSKFRVQFHSKINLLEICITDEVDKEEMTLFLSQLLNYIEHHKLKAKFLFDFSSKKAKYSIMDLRTFYPKILDIMKTQKVFQASIITVTPYGAVLGNILGQKFTYQYGVKLKLFCTRESAISWLGIL